MNTLFRHLLTGIFVLVSVYSAVNANAAPVFSLNFTLEPSLKVDQTFLDGSGVLREGTGSATNLVCGMNLALTNFLALYGNISIPSDIISSSTDENGYYTDDPSGNMDGDLIGQYGVSELSRDHNEYGIQIIPISGWVLGSSLNCTVAGNLGYQSV
ncbi:MAG TPA: hypothetical protein VHV83_03755, partial [Armatimonadota bacterium]|nr:hypothetical protein [Armatimonadota bacterium]